MNASTLKNIRMAYYLGIMLLVFNALPKAKEYFDFIFEYQIPIVNVTVVTVIAIGTAIGAFMAFNRKYI